MCYGPMAEEVYSIPGVVRGGDWPVDGTQRRVEKVGGKPVDGEKALSEAGVRELCQRALPGWAEVSLQDIAFQRMTNGAGSSAAGIVAKVTESARAQSYILS